MGQEGGSSRARVAVTLSVVAYGLDSLYVSIHGRLRSEVVEALERTRALAAQARAALPLPLGSVVHQIAGSGARGGWSWQASCPDWRLVAAVRGAADPAPTLQVQFDAAFLWAFGWRGAFDLWLHRVGIPMLGGPPSKLAVSRADPCCDFVGWIPRRADEPAFVRQPRKVVGRMRLLTGELAELPPEQARTVAAEEADGSLEDFNTGAIFTGWRWGARSAPTICRLYDKTEEIRVASGKSWFASEVWAWPAELAALPEEERPPVWRLEFECKREGIRAWGIDTVDDLEHRLPQLWSALIGVPGDEEATGWISLREPRRSMRARWPVHPAWLELQRGAWRTKEAPLVQDRRREMDAEQTLAAVTRGLYRLAVLKGAPDEVTEPDELLEWARSRGLLGTYLSQRQVSPAELLSEFRARLPLQPH